jgi:hypothetical protein
MIRIILGILGLSLLIFVMVDLIWTTLFLGGGGPLTHRFTNALWHRMLERHHANTDDQLPAPAGLWITLLNFSLWLLLISVSWTLIFNMAEGAVVETSSGEPADFWARAYFTGFTLITLGVGDYRPIGAVWQMLTVAAAANGFFLVTLAITYLLPLVQAVVQKRQTAAYISSLGETPDDILLNAWTGSDFGRLEDHLVTLAPRLMELGQSHLAYPVLHCFHSGERETAVAPSIAALDEALTMLRHGVDKRAHPDASALFPLRAAITKFLTTVGGVSDQERMDAPPPPSLNRLRAHGIPVLDDEDFVRDMDEQADRRRLLVAMVRSEGWSWEAVASTVPLDERPGTLPEPRQPPG